MKQLDVDVVVSPPAFVWDPNMELTHMTFDLDPCSQVMNFYLVTYFLVTFGMATHRQTESNAYEPIVH